DVGRLQFAQILFRRRRVGKGRERGRRDVILAQHLLGEGLAAFEPRRLAAGREDFEAALGKKFGDAERQRQLRPDDRQVDEVFLGEGGELCEIVDADRRQSRALADAVVSRRDKDLIDARALTQLPNERVLAPAAADDEDFHGYPL